jgi:hypothetical protein
MNKILLTVRCGVTIDIEGELKTKWLIVVLCGVVWCIVSSSHHLDPLIVFLFMGLLLLLRQFLFWFCFLSPHGGKLERVWNGG